MCSTTLNTDDEAYFVVDIIFIHANNSIFRVIFRRALSQAAQSYDDTSSLLLYLFLISSECRRL